MCLLVLVLQHSLSVIRLKPHTNWQKWLSVARALFLYFQALAIDINIMENNKVEISTANDKHAAPFHINVLFVLLLVVRLSASVI